MKKTRSSRHLWERFRHASQWYFLAGFIICSLVAVFALRQNNLAAIVLRDQVLQVDEQNGDVEAALRQLREHIYSHMNASLSSGSNVQQPVQLKYRYERLVEAEKKRVEKANESIYPQAQAHCERTMPGSFYGGPRVACIESYVLERGEKQREIPDDLYKFDFASPRWSPDLAGFSILLAGVFFVLFAVKVILDRWLKVELNE